MEVKFDRRLIAYLLDLLFTLCFSSLIYFGVYEYSFIFSTLSVFIWLEIFNMFFYSLISILFTLIFRGRTLGSMLTRTKTVSANGKHLSARQALLKFIPQSIFILAVINACYMVHVHTEETVFDKLSNTKVVSTKIMSL